MSLRSLLFVPATSAQHRIGRLLEARTKSPLPDGVIVDLEDSVPESVKVAARASLQGVLEGVQRLADLGVGIYVRVNGANTPHFAADLAAVAPWATRGVGVMISKCAGHGDVMAVMAMPAGLSGGAIIPLIETLEGFRNRDTLMAWGAQAGVRHIAFGAGDMSLELGIERDYRLPLMQHVIMSLVVSAKLHRLALIDAPSRVIPSTVSDRGWQVLLAEESQWSRANGFSGKLAVHPDQIETLHAAFDQDAQIDWAKQVLADFAKDPDRRSLVSSVSGIYMGTPTLKQAQAILARAELTPAIPCRPA